MIIFDIFESFWKDSPIDRREKPEEEWFREPFEEMIKTEDDRKFYKMIELESPVNPDSARASYKNGILTLELDKKEKRTGKEIKIE